MTVRFPCVGQAGVNNPERVERHGLKMDGECRKQLSVMVGIFPPARVPLVKPPKAIQLPASCRMRGGAQQLEGMRGSSRIEPASHGRD